MSEEPKKRSRAWIWWASFAGLPFLYMLSGVILLSFALGIGTAEAIVEMFWPQWGGVIWIRLSGGIAALAVLAFGLKLAWGKWAPRHRVRFILLGFALIWALAWLGRYWTSLVWNQPGE
jgi:hypothetical protein